MPRSFRLGCVFAAACLLAVSATAQPAAYPSKPIRLIVPFAAGGPADVVARDLGQMLGKDMNTTVVVENQGGGGGLTALGNVVRASADGYTLLFAASGNVVVQPLLVKQPVDVLTKLAPVALVSTSPHVLVVSSKLPVKTPEEFVAYAKAHPGKVNFGSAGVGGLSHLGMELFKVDAKVDVNHIPYKGTSQVMTDLASGEVQAMLSSMPSMVGMIEQGAIRAIGITAPSNSASMKGLPELSKTVPGYEYVTWYGIYSTIGTPQPVVDRLNAAIVKAVADPAFRQRTESQGVDAQSSTPKELAELTRKDTAKWSQIIKSAKIELN